MAPSLWGCAVNGPGRLSLGGVDLVELAGTYGTALQVVDKAALQRNYAAFVGAFRALYPNTELATSFKTNALPGVLAALHAAMKVGSRLVASIR
ncbi:MAG: hypothetical protein H6926_00900 [Chromatiales bacterium]|nr:hypothetical protein [Gammaproteobacteria bacterium]MCP5351737.1 hypothetical protein [Chromatiales bacterium]